MTAVRWVPRGQGYPRASGQALQGWGGWGGSVLRLGSCLDRVGAPGGRVPLSPVSSPGAGRAPGSCVCFPSPHPQPPALRGASRPSAAGFPLSPGQGLGPAPPGGGGLPEEGGREPPTAPLPAEGGGGFRLSCFLAGRETGPGRAAGRVGLRVRPLRPPLPQARREMEVLAVGGGRPGRCLVPRLLALPVPMHAGPSLGGGEAARAGPAGPPATWVAFPRGPGPARVPQIRGEPHVPARPRGLRASRLPPRRGGPAL